MAPPLFRICQEIPQQRFTTNNIRQEDRRPRQATIRCQRPRADSIEVSTHFLLLSCFSILLDASVPLVALILPIPALSVTDAGKRLHQFDHQHILGLLVAELPFEAETERRAVR